MSHARPHLETHTRSKGHSALAGVAYRLGLRVFDKRQGIWHDYRRRKIGEEVVAAFTLAPAGAPDWATDPERVWVAVEAAEKRKDSQLAHDFRLPIPLGLSETTAITMAREMAQRVVDDLGTVASVGLHRDSGLDAMGFAKPTHKTGYHAHIYFPTRRLSFVATDAEGQQSAEDGGDGSAGWAFTDKIKALSHKAMAAVVIERLNQAWADLANHHASAAGFVPDFTHLSYARLGLDKLPQIRLGPSATALERRGVATRLGDLLRAGEAAAVDASAPPMPTVASAVQGPDDHATIAVSNRAWLEPASPIVTPVRMSATAAERPVTSAAVHGLAARFFADLDAKPELKQPTVEERARLATWLTRIERVLHGLAALGRRLADLLDHHRRDDGARATFLVELDERRRQRAEARQAVLAWKADHPWQVRWARAARGMHGTPTVLAELEGCAHALNAQVQQFKRGAAEAVQRVAELDGRIGRTRAEQARQQQELSTLGAGINAMDPLYRMVLLSVAGPEHLATLDAAMPAVPVAQKEDQGVTVVLRSPELPHELKPERRVTPRPGL